MKFDFQIDQREEEKDNSGFLPDVKEALSIQEDQDDDEIMQNSVVDEVDGGEVMEEEEEVVQVNAPLTVDTVLSNISELSNPELLSKGLNALMRAAMRIQRELVDYEISSEADLLNKFIKRIIPSNAEELFKIWHLQQKEKIASLELIILDTLSRLITVTKLLGDHARPFGAVLVKRIISSEMVTLFRNLSSSTVPLVHASLRLLVAVAEFSPQYIRALQENFNFGMKSLLRLFRYRKKAATTTTNQSSSSETVSTPSAPPRRTENPEDIRSLYIRFIVAFLIHGDDTVKKRALDMRDFVSGIAKGLTEDCFEQVKFALDIFKTHVALDETLGRSVKVSFFNNYMLEQISKLYTRNTVNDATNTPLLEKSTNEEEDNQVNHMESTTPLPTVADLAHEFLLFITTNPGTGVCFQDAGWYKSNRVKTISSSSDTFDHAFGERAKTQVYNTTLLRFLGILSPSEDERQRALILAILTACPELVQPYWNANSLSFDPRLSEKWMANMAFCTNVIQLPVPSKLSVGSKATQAAVPLLIGSETPVISVLIDNIIPPCLTRTVLSKALQHSDSTVRYVTSFLLNCVFEKIEAVKREIAEAKLVAAGGITELETKWDVLLSTLISEVKKRVPDVNIIVALHQQQISSLVTLTSSTTTSSSNNARSEDKMEVDDDAFDVTSSSPMQVDSDGQPLDSLENNDTALPLDNSSSDSPELSVSVSLKLLKNYQIHYPNLFLEIRFDHGKLITPSLHTLHPEIQVNLLGLMESVSDFKFWSVTAGQKLSHLGIVLKLFLTTEVHNIQQRSKSLIIKCLTESFLFQTHKYELMIWLDLLSELYNCNSVELASQILEWVDKVICTAAKNPYKFIDAMNSILKECVVADHQQQDGDSHLQITAAQVQEQRIRFAILERTAPEFLEHVDELSLLRAGTAVSEEEVLLPCSPAFLVLVMSYASDSKKLASSASAALMGQFVVRLSSDVLYSTQISASFMCRLIRHVLEQGAEKDLSQACNSEALTSWVHSRASSESEWTAKDYVMSVLSSVFRITASSPLHSLSSMNALSSIMKKAAVTPGHKTINLEPQLGASISLTFLNRNLERFVKSSRDAVISHLMTRHPSMGSVFVVFDAIKAIWVLDNDSAKSLKSPLFDGLLRHLPPSFLLANWFAAVESTPSIYSSSILKRLILGLVKKSNAVVLANQVLLELGSLLRHRNDDIQIDCAQNGVKFAFEVLEQAVVVCRNGHDGKTFLTVREMCFRSTSIQDRFMSLSHGGGSIWKEVDSGVCSLSRNVIQLNSYWSQSSTCLDFYSRKCADAILELGDTSSEGDDEDDFCIIQVFASFKDCMSISDLNRIVECIGNCLVVKNSKMSPSRKKRKRNSLHFAEALLPLLFTVKQPYGSKETGGRVKINASIFKHLLSMMSLLIEENTTTTSSSSTGTNLLAMKHAVEHVLLAYLSPPSSSSALSRSIVVMDENFSVPANVPSLFSNELVDQLISQCSGHDWQTARLVGLILRSSVNQRQRLAGIVSRRELEEPPATIMCIAILRSFMDGFCSVKMVCIGAKSSSDPSAPQHHLARLLIKNTGSNEESAIKRMYKQIRADLSTQLAHIFDDDLVGIDGGSEEEEMMEIDAREKLVVARYILKEPMFLFNLASIVKMEQGSVLQNALSGFFASQTGGTDPSVLCERMCTLFEPLLSSCFPKNEEVNIDDASTSTAVLVVDRTVGQLFAKLLAAVSICLQTYISKTVKKLPNDTVLSSFIASNSAENIIGKLIEYSRILIQVLTKNWASIGGAKSLDNLTSLTPEGDSLWNLLQSVIMSCMKYRLLDPRCMFFIGDLIHLMSKAVNLHMPIQNFIEMITTHSQFEVAMTIEHESKDENLSAKAGVIELIYSLMRLDPIKGCNPNHLTLLSLYFTGQQTPEDLSLQRVFNLYESRVGISTSTYLLNRKVKSASDSEKLLDIVNGDIFGVLDIANMQTSVEMFDINVGLQDLDKPSSNTNNNTYSPQFLLPLTAHALELDFENKLDLRVMVESNVIGLAVMALSSVKSDMRKMGYFVLDKFFPKLRTADFKEQPQVSLLLDTLKNSITDRDEPQQLPVIISLFIARGLPIMLKPESHMYYHINRFLLQRPILFLEDIPLFYNLFYSTSTEFRREKGWVLRLIANGLRSGLDYKLCQKRYVFDTIMGYFQSPLSDTASRKLILEIMLNASLVPSIVADLVAHDGLLTFMQNCVGYLTMEPENSFVLRIIKVISHLFRGWSAANSNWHGRSGVLVWFKSFSNVVADLIEKIGTNFSSTAFPFAASSLTPEHSVWRMNVLLEISKLVNLLCTSEWRQDNVLTLQHLATIIKYVQELRTVVSSEAVDVMVPAMMTTTTTTITKRGGRLNDVERDMDRAYGIICRQIFSSLTSSKAFISTGTLNFLKPLPSLSATSPSLEIVIRWCMQLIENHVLRDDSCSGVNGGVSAGLVIGSDLMLEALAPEEEWLKWMLQLQHNHSLILSCSSGVGSSVSSLPLSLWGLLLDHFLKITSVRLGASSCCALYGYYNVKCLLLNASQRLEDDTFPAAALGKRRRNNDEDKLETEIEDVFLHTGSAGDTKQFLKHQAQAEVAWCGMQAHSLSALLHPSLFAVDKL